MIEKAPKLKIISRNGVGYDAIDRAACEENSIAVTNMPGINSQAVAEVSRGPPEREDAGRSNFVRWPAGTVFGFVFVKKSA